MVFTDNWSIQNIVSEHINKIKPGFLCKISNGEERFYLIVVRCKKNGEIIGKVNNVLVVKKPYNYNDLISFRKNNCIEIFSIEDRIVREKQYTDIMKEDMKDIIPNYILKYGKYPTTGDLLSFYESDKNIRIVEK